MTVKVLRGGSVLAAAILLVSWAVHAANADALWNIVHTQCVPHWQQAQDPAPCARVEMGQGEDKGFIVLKDIRGVLQYLLIPTARISGIESPLLLQDAAPDYWAEAWEARSWMAQLRGAPLPRQAVALTVNSPLGRSQNQLHIHVSCVAAAAVQQLRQANADGQWHPLPGGLNGHPYQVRALVGDSLRGVLPFRQLADGIPAARDEMGRYTLAVVATTFSEGPGFWLLAGKADLLAANTASAEGDVQDHSCSILQNDSGTP